MNNVIRPTRPTRRRTAQYAGLAALMIGALSACGAVKSAAGNAVEGAVEKAIESDSGEDVDLEFGSGGLSIETDEGSMEFDAETGEFVLVDEDGEVISGSLDIDEDGLNIESTEGSVSIDESGEFVVTDSEGEEVAGGEVSEDGEIDATFETEDGEGTLRSGVDVASDWPSDVLRPYPGATVVQAAEFDTAEGTSRVLTLNTSDSLEQVYEFYDEATEDWTGTRGNADGSAFLMVTNETHTVQMGASETPSGTEISLVLIEAPS